MGDILSGLFGGQTPQGFNIPAFTSSGGITPDQAALTQYSLDENDLATRSQFASSGTGLSTMAEQAMGGNRYAAAQQAGQMSDVNQGAEYTAYKNQIANLEGQLQTQATVAGGQAGQQSQLDTLAGQAAGLGGNAFGGGTSGSFT
jgi:hypothetical protein